MVTLEQVQSRITKLQKKAEDLLRKKNASVIADIKALLAKHGLTTADIDAHSGVARTAGKRGRPAGTKNVKKTATAARKSTSPAKGKLPAKYMNPKTGETWSGWARPPAWIKDVKDRSKFLIAGVTDSTAAGTDVVTKTTAAAKKGTAKKTTTAKKVTAKKAAGARKAPAKKAAVATKKIAAKKAVSAKASAKKAGPAAKTMPAKRVPRKSAAVTAPATTVESGAESMT
jgi:DNA-binding protein H-NS